MGWFSKQERSKAPRRRWPWVVVGLFLATGLFLLFYPYPALPTVEVLRARQALLQAKAGVREFGYSELTKAEGKASYMERLYAVERDKWLRFFEPTELRAAIAETERSALLALQTSRDQRTKALEASNVRRLELVQSLQALGNEVKFFTKDGRLRGSFNRADLAMIQARQAIERGEVKIANAALDKVESELGDTEKMLGNRYQRLLDPDWRRRWQAWVDETIAGSRGGAPAIVVDKLGRRLAVVRGGQVVATYDAEFGRNGLADKLHAGDGATPEGRYYVKSKRDWGETRWHRALVINYPNAEDWNRYQTAKRAGQVGRWSIGSNIEIHGNGGKKTNWTEGCVALRDAEIDKVYSMVPVGTPVTIVGSARLPGDSAAQPHPAGTR